jgi:hypothetical protein
MRVAVFALVVGCHASSATAPIDTAAADVPVHDAALDAARSTGDFTIVALPDTQYYNGTLGWVFDDQTRWIVDHAPDRNIELVVGLGDIVDGGGPPASGACPTGAAPPGNWQAQWTHAASAIDKLDGHVPYLLAIGNHDYDCEAARPQPRALTNWDHYFGPARYVGKPWFTGDFNPANHADLWNIAMLGGEAWLVVALPFYPTNSDLAWASNVIDQHAALRTIIITHSYMYYDKAGPGTALRVGTGDPDSAGSYKLGPTCPEQNITTCGNGNNGSDVWDKLVSQHANIALVLSGHFPLPMPGASAPDNNGVGYRSELAPLGNRVDQILSDYQGQGRNGAFGNGYLRIYTFSPATSTLRVSTYSPAAELHPTMFPNAVPPPLKTDAYNQFDLPY